MYILFVKQATYMSMMKDTTSLNRGGYDGLLEIYRSAHNFEERNRVLGTCNIITHT